MMAETTMWGLLRGGSKTGIQFADVLLYVLEALIETETKHCSGPDLYR
jgi:hypothetical protein